MSKEKLFTVSISMELEVYAKDDNDAEQKVRKEIENYLGYDAMSSLVIDDVEESEKP